MGYKVIIAEKRSVGEDIARVLGVNIRKDGYMEGNGYIVSWARGHLCGLKDAQEYNPAWFKWNINLLPIIPEKFEHSILKDTKNQFNILKELVNRKDVDEVINACDAGREGELIFCNIYLMADCKKPVKRLWISSMEDKAILDGFANLKPGEDYHNLYLAASCREMADWLVGINLTRLLSLKYNRTLNVGRVVSPTLSIIASREDEIKNFIPEKYYNVKIECDDFSAVSDKFASKDLAEVVKNECQGKCGSCIEVSKVMKKEKAPLLYDLTVLQKDANKFLKYTAKQTLDTAQSLYEKKLITYPRSDSRYLSHDMLEKVKRVISYSANNLDNIYSTGLEEQLLDDEKVTDHTAIIPTENIEVFDQTSLSDSEFNILKLIERQMLISSSPDYEYESCKAKIEVGKQIFTASYIRVLQYGWKKYFNKNDDNDIQELNVDIDEGEICYVNDIKVVEGKTKPKPYYTEDTLLSAMENAGAKDMPDDAERKGLGTPATRADIIEKLVSKGFVRRDKGKLIPDETGMNLVAVLPEEMRSPLLTAEWEQSLKDVEKGNKTAYDFMTDIIDMVKTTVRDYETVENAEALFPSGEERVGKCPRCGKDVVEKKYKDGKVRGYFCTDEECGFKMWKENDFLKARNIRLDKPLVKGLLLGDRMKVPEMKSVKSGKYYCGYLFLEDDGERISYRISI